MMLTTLWTVITIALLLVGSIFTLVAGIGLLKLSDPMTRLHAPTKAATLGIGAFLLASVTDGLSRGEDSFHEILVLAFIFVTAPISANFISKVNLHSRACDLPSSPKTDGRWSTFDVHELDRDVKPHPDADF